uniref:Uncharacterized protein n=2 Tax=Chrysotila carterae TaxID=13221 RepID=A0A7S4F2U6_CHRCT
MELYDSKANGGPALANGSNVALMSQKRLETLKSPASAPGPAAANGAAAADAGVPAPRTQREGGGSGAPAATGDGAATHGAGRDGATAEASSKREPTMAADDEQRSKRPRESIPALGTG